MHFMASIAKGDEESGGPTRTYNSPLREAQAEQTRDRILDALAEMVAEDGFDGIVVKDLAARAGMSERTVYRHYPDRDALHDALAARVVEQAGWDVHPLAGSIDELPALVEETYRSFDEIPVPVTVAARLNSVRSRVSSDTHQRRADMRAFVVRELPDLDDDVIDDLVAVLQVLGSSRTWLRLREEHGRDGTSSGALVRWLLTLALEDLRAGGGPRRGAAGAASPS